MTWCGKALRAKWSAIVGEAEARHRCTMIALTLARAEVRKAPVDLVVKCEEDFNAYREMLEEQGETLTPSVMAGQEMRFGVVIDDTKIRICWNPWAEESERTR